MALTQKRAELLLILINMGWGASYLLMKIGLEGVSPLMLIGLRFGIAFGAMALVFHRALRGITRRILAQGALLGLLLFGLFAALLHGLKTTSASSAGFLTNTTVICVPILQACLTKKLPAPPVAGGILVTLAGVALLTIRDTFTIEGGALLCVLGAFIYAVHILLTSRLVQEGNELQLGILQLGFASVFGFGASLLFETPALPSTPSAWLAVLALALVCSAFGNALQPVVQRHVPAERVGVLFALEPLFAALFGFVFLHEVLGPRGYLGAAVILAGVLLSGWKPRQAAPPPEGLPSAP